jgi:hypothetical protein
MTEREVEPIVDKLREAEELVLSILRDDTKKQYWRAADECKVAVWKAMEAAGDIAR